MSWHATTVTLFPDMLPGPLGYSLAGRALRDGLWRCDSIDLRTHGDGRHRNVDDTPAGGGVGMVLRPDVVDAALGAALSLGDPARPLLCLTPRGRLLDQRRVAELAAGPGVVLLCGRYEGIDQRVIDARGMTEISVGDYVLSGGEPAALVLLDACVRLLPGVMGASASAHDESHGAAGLLEYPQYTRPTLWCGVSVPAVLLSGNHAAIEGWRQAEAARITRERRPDLWARSRAQASAAGQRSACNADLAGSAG